MLRQQTPDSPIIPFGATKLDDILTKLHQWSELSPGYISPSVLLESCVLDADGKVFTASKVTELTGEAWRSAAQIYLHCRFYRYWNLTAHVKKKISLATFHRRSEAKELQKTPYTSRCSCQNGHSG